jgi:hypothetical protein
MSWKSGAAGNENAPKLYHAAALLWYKMASQGAALFARICPH